MTEHMDYREFRRRHGGGPHAGERQGPCQPAQESAGSLRGKAQEGSHSPTRRASSSLPRGGRPWSNAKRTVCALGHRHDSKLEAKVCARVEAEEREKTPIAPRRILRQVRFPLIEGALNMGKPLYMTIDFAVFQVVGVTSNPHGPPGGSWVGQPMWWRLVRLVDAKGRRSRDWTRGKAMLEASYGVAVEEVTE